MDRQLDPEMLKNLDVLIDLDLFENEKDWEIVESAESLNDAIDTEEAER